jgi:hypothetical protein
MLNTIFLLVETLDFPEHPAEHGIDFNVVVAFRTHTNTKFLRPFSLASPAKRTLRISGWNAVTIFFCNRQAHELNSILSRLADPAAYLVRPHQVQV